MNNKFKTNENSKISVLLVDKEWVNEEDGKRYIKTHWEVLTEPLNLGSIKEPKAQNVAKIKIEIPDDKNEENPFAKFFKGFGG